MKIKFHIPFSRLVKLFTLTLMIYSSSFSANAEIDFSGTYVSLIFSDSAAKFTSSGGSDEFNSGHIKGKIGWILNDVISVEGQFGGCPYNPDGIWFRDVFTYGAYIRASKDLGQYKFYGLLGLTDVRYRSAFGDKTSISGLNYVKDSESGGSYGVGVEIFGAKNLAVTFEYLMLLDKSIDNNLDVAFDTIGLGFTYYFTEDKSYFNKNRNKIKSIRY